VRWGVPATGRTPHNRYGGPPLVEIPALGYGFASASQQGYAYGGYPPVRTRLISLVLSLVRADVPAYHSAECAGNLIIDAGNHPPLRRLGLLPTLSRAALRAAHSAWLARLNIRLGSTSLLTTAYHDLSATTLVRPSASLASYAHQCTVMLPSVRQASTAQSTGTTVVATVLPIRISVSARNAFGVLAATIIVRPECAVRNRTLVLRLA